MADAKEVLYCGDATLETGACYLGGVMAKLGIRFDYVPMEERFPEALLEAGHRLVVLSDYPSGNFPPRGLERLAQKVAEGTSLLMVGGWESFHGLVGNYQSSALAPVLPVDCLEADDRVNWCQGLVPVVVIRHPILGELPWGEPPIVCGCNRVRAKSSATVVLALRPLQIRDGRAALGEESLPLLVTGTHGKGRTAAVTTDFAPHWVGGMVDWGDTRVSAEASGGRPVEVGHLYVAFLGNLLSWLLGR